MSEVRAASEFVQIVGMLDKDANSLRLQAQVTVTFSLPPEIYSPGMKMIVVKELQDAVVRIVDRECARKDVG